MDDLSLDKTFIHQTRTHIYHIKWTRFGKKNATPVVFIHGTPWSSVEWHGLAKALSSRFDIYLYDHPGFGSSPSPQRRKDEINHKEVDLDGSLAVRTEASFWLFEHWGFQKPPNVVAHDNGGLVSLRLLLENRIRFASLCLIDVVAIGPFGLPFFELVAKNTEVFKAIPSQFVEGFVRAYVRNATLQSMTKEVEDILCAPWLSGGTQGPVRFFEEMEQAHNRDNRSVERVFADVGGLAPTKMIWGKEDAWLPVEIASRLKTALNARELVIIEEAGHLVQYDQPAKLALEVGLWLIQNE